MILKSDQFGRNKAGHMAAENTEERLEEKVDAFIDACRNLGLKLTHQRLEIFKELARSKEHPSAETLFRAATETDAVTIARYGVQDTDNIRAARRDRPCACLGWMQPVRCEHVATPPPRMHRMQQSSRFLLALNSTGRNSPMRSRGGVSPSEST